MKKSIRKHFMLVIAAYFVWGIGATFQQLGVKAGISFEIVITVTIVTLAFFMIIMLTSMEKVTKYLRDQEEKDK